MSLTRQVLSATLLLVVLFLVLTHFTGFESDIKALGSAYTGGVKALQGR